MGANEKVMQLIGNNSAEQAIPLGFASAIDDDVMASREANQKPILHYLTCARCRIDGEAPRRGAAKSSSTEGGKMSEEKPFHVLLLTGGAFRGLYSARVRQELEQCAGRPIGQCFDLVVGTSIGGIIALAVAFE